MVRSTLRSLARRYRSVLHETSGRSAQSYRPSTCRPVPYARALRRNLAGSAGSALCKDLACPTDLKDASCDLRNFSNCPTLAIVNCVGRGGAPPGPKNAKAADVGSVHGPSEYHKHSIDTLHRTGSEDKTQDDDYVSVEEAERRLAALKSLSAVQRLPPAGGSKSKLALGWTRRRPRRSPDRETRDGSSKPGYEAPVNCAEGRALGGHREGRRPTASTSAKAALLR
jgi:hypothetical protein